MNAIRIAMAVLCVGAVGFWLRVLLGFVKEKRVQPRGLKVYFTKFNPPKQRGELIFMNASKKQYKYPAKSVKRAVLVLTTALLFTSYGRGQQTSTEPAASAKEVQELKDLVRTLAAKVDELEKQQKQSALSGKGSAAEPDPVPAGSAGRIADLKNPEVSPQPASSITSAGPDNVPANPEKKQKAEPFAFADFTWLNGNSRVKDVPFDTKFFTPEVQADVDYIVDFNHPADDTIGGSSEVFRAYEVQLTQLGVGGDFHYDNVRGRLMTQFGMYSFTTPRNDASPARGQWSLDTAYRYISEAYGGYHFNALHGINVDAGIFMSYVGLFSYYNADNWAYQPSYVSSNTPWFFNGVRVQIFPTEHFKIEPWFVNGWQSYGRFNHRPGIGAQLLWRPNGKFEILGNQYMLGADTLGVAGRIRYHTDDSIEYKYYDNPETFISKAAFSLTGDAGCEHGGDPVAGTAVSCDTNSIKVVGGKRYLAPKQSFLGFMVYNRLWFHKNLFGFTLGGGKINNPGRYLVLLPPINGATAATAATATPYFTENPGDPYKAWDASATFDYMPSQYITFRWEYDHRAANVPYFSGRGGITPPGGNNGNPAVTVPGWAGPDLVKDENRLDLAILVKF